MKLLAFNGSPRGTNSSSYKLNQWVARNSKAYENFEVIHEHLYKTKEHEAYIIAMKEADAILITFPLYVDSTPGIVKAFFEAIEPHKSELQGKPIYFIIHNGFPEKIHSRSVSRYVEYFTTNIMQMRFMGNIIIGMSEMIRQAPANANHKKLEATSLMLDCIVNNRVIDQSILDKLGAKDTYSIGPRILYTLIPFKDIMWKKQAKANGCKSSIYDKPYK